MQHTGVLSPGTNFKERVHTTAEIVEIVKGLRALKQVVVLTSGSYDLKHVGHDRYLEQARSKGNFLIVGVDSDAKVRERKKDMYRPIVPELERMEQLTHLRHVDAVVLKHPEDPPHHLMRSVRPDVLIISKSSKHTDEAIEDMKKYCGRIELLEPQAQTSTTAQIRLLLIEGVEKFVAEARQGINAVFDNLVSKIKGA
jgi:rfaE bifunctional protein nucleotidyltransferase chain/domain